MMRKLTPYLLMLVITLQTVGFSVFFSFEQARIRRAIKTKIKEGVPENELHTFDFSRDAFSKLHFIKKKEFKLNGHFYDIVWKFKLKNNQLRIKCVDDVQEARLFKNLALMVGKTIDKTGKNAPLKVVFHYLHLPSILPSPPKPITSRNHFINVEKKHFHYKEIISSALKETYSPPPEFC